MRLQQLGGNWREKSRITKASRPNGSRLFRWHAAPREEILNILQPKEAEMKIPKPAKDRLHEHDSRVCLLFGQV